MDEVGKHIDDLEARRLSIYKALAATGRVPGTVKLAQEWGISELEAAGVMAALAADRHVVLNSEGDIQLAHPFATRDFGFSVKSQTVLWWGGCAWDAFAVAHLVPGASPALVATTCPGCGTAHAWNVSSASQSEGTQLVHFLVPMANVWDDVVHACENQSIFCDESCLADWRASTGHQRGFTFDIPTLWRLSSKWYAGRLDPGYKRREPAEAASYFQGVGLSGDFWGNETAGPAED